MSLEPRQISSFEETGIDAWDYAGVSPERAREHMAERDIAAGLFSTRRKSVYVLTNGPQPEPTTPRIVREPRARDWEKRSPRRSRPR